MGVGDADQGTERSAEPRRKMRRGAGLDTIPRGASEKGKRLGLKGAKISQRSADAPRQKAVRGPTTICQGTRHKGGRERWTWTGENSRTAW